MSSTPDLISILKMIHVDEKSCFNGMAFLEPKKMPNFQTGSKNEEGEMAEKILVVDDEESIRFTFQIFLSKEGYEVFTAENYDSAVDFLNQETFALIFVDIVLDGSTGLDLLQAIKEKTPSTPVIVITGAPSIETAVHSLRLGAFDYIVKPIRKESLLHITRMAIEHQTLLDDRENCLLNLEGIFRSVKDGIIMVDADLVVKEFNQAAETICGIRRSEVVGKQITTITDHCDGKCISALEEVYANRTPIELRYIECHSEHHPRQVVSVTASPLLDKKEAFTGTVMVIRDETRMVDLERSLKNRPEFEAIIGESEGIKKTKSLIRDLADVQTTVLITGESGTGKEMVVDALHQSGNRRQKLLVKVNCAALSETLLESELFGHVPGAFTGAVRHKIGRFELANGGTLFLDEIGDTSQHLQLRLLRVIESMEFEKVGGRDPC
jgi:two-component system, NtrC family, response regulator HydG